MENKKSYKFTTLEKLSGGFFLLISFTQYTVNNINRASLLPLQSTHTLTSLTTIFLLLLLRFLLLLVLHFLIIQIKICKFYFFCVSVISFQYNMVDVFKKKKERYIKRVSVYNFKSLLFRDKHFLSTFYSENEWEKIPRIVVHLIKKKFWIFEYYEQ